MPAAHCTTLRPGVPWREEYQLLYSLLLLFAASSPWTRVHYFRPLARRIQLPPPSLFNRVHQPQPLQVSVKLRSRRNWTPTRRDRTIHCTLKDWEVMAAICATFKELVGKKTAKLPPHVWVSVAEQQGIQEEEKERLSSDGEEEDGYSHVDWSHDAVCVRSRELLFMLLLWVVVCSVFFTTIIHLAGDPFFQAISQYQCHRVAAGSMKVPRNNYSAQGKLIFVDVVCCRIVTKVLEV